MQSSKHSAENGLNNKNRNIWEQYRPVTSINFSDIIEEKTIYDRTGQIETTFESTDMGNHPDIDPDAVSVDDILGNSIVHEIRHMSQSRHGNLSTSIRASIPNRLYGSQLGVEDIGSFTSDKLANESFRPAEEMLDQIQKDENDWERSRADVPFMENGSFSESTSSARLPNHLNVPKMHRQLANMSDFSGYLVDNSVNDDLSIGRYFSNRCGDLQDMIPTKSPTKRHAPIPLFSSSIQQEEPRKKPLAKLSTSTYKTNDNEQLQDSIASLSTIANQLEESDTDSPRTFLNKLYSNRNEALSKENVELLKQTASQLKNCHFGLNVHAKESTNMPRINGNVSSNDDFNNMMNSTKIDEKENERRDSSMDTDSLDSGASSTNVTLGSGYSPIKTNRMNKCDDGNACSNKRSRSTDQSSYLDNKTATSPPVKNLSPRPNQRNVNHVNGEATDVRRTARLRPVPIQAPLDDISSSIFNNYNRSSTKSNHSSETGAIRQCATDLGSFNSQRRYDNRSSDYMKMSLPAYGLQGMRTYSQEAITVDKRCNSQCSTRSEYTQNDGKFPLKSNTSELVWECVRLRKSVTKSLVIKNTSDKKLSLKVGVIGPGYQIASSCDSDSLVLQGHECRTINVTFCPTIIGKAMGKLIFKPIKNWPEELERSVYLWAYGGSTVLQLQGIERGPVGCSFLKMGETSNIVTTTLERSFSIYNKGPLNGVATVFVKPKTNQCINENHITIEPNKCVIRPDGTATIRVIYKLRRKDIERLREKSCEVLTIGTLEVIFGSEPNRQRIASILTRQGNVPTSYKQLEFLVNDFPVARMEDFKDYREHVDNVSDLFGCFRTSEIALTINRTSLDETRTADLSCIDDSVLFRTLCETPKQNAKQQQTNGTSKPMDSNLWTVHPKSLKMDPRNNSRKSITVQSFFNHVQTFQIDSNIASYLNFSPKSGKIGPNTEFQIHVELKKNLHIPTLNGMITVYFESFSVDIPISVQPVPYNYM